MTSIFRTAVCLIVLASLLVGCGKQSPGANSPVHITVYTALEPEEVGVLVPEFEAEHPGIKIDTVRASTGVITARLMAEASNPQADLVWGLAATSLLNADRIGLLAPYSPKGLDQLSPEFRDKREPPHWEGIDGYMTAFAVNTIEITKANVPAPQSYADLAKPIYRGMVTMPNPTMSGTGFLTVAGILQIMGEEQGWKYLDQLNQNVAAYTPSGSSPVTLAGTGEHPIGVSFDFRVLEEIKRGTPLEIIFPKEKSGWEMEANALITKPNIKPAAQVFLDWAIGPKAFAYYSQHYGILANPEFLKAPPGFPEHPQDQMIKNNFAWAAENRDRILAEWKSRYGGKTAVKTG
jgi:iron(III) transport system substrate-binding protein